MERIALWKEAKQMQKEPKTGSTPFCRTETASPFRIWLSEYQNWKSGFFAILGILGMLGGAFGFAVWTHVLNAKLASHGDLPLRSGTAVVLDKNTTYGNRNAPRTVEPEIIFRVEGHIVVHYPRDSTLWARTPIGATVPVRYRVAPGEVYIIEDWQAPLQKARLP